LRHFWVVNLDRVLSVLEPSGIVETVSPGSLGSDIAEQNLQDSDLSLNGLVYEWFVSFEKWLETGGGNLSELRRVFGTADPNPDCSTLHRTQDMSRGLAEILFRYLLQSLPPQSVGHQCDQRLCSGPEAFECNVTRQVDSMLPGINDNHVVLMDSQRGLDDAFCYRIIGQAKTSLYEDLPRN